MNSQPLNSKENLTNAFYRLYSQFQSQEGQFPKISHDLPLNNALTNLTLFSWENAGHEPQKIVDMIVKSSIKVQQKGDQTFWMMVENYEKLLVLAMKSRCLQVGLWICLFIAKCFLEKKENAHAQQYFMKYQLIYLKWCEIDPNNENNIPIIELSDLFHPNFEELYLNSVQAITIYGLGLKAHQPESQEMSLLKEDQDDPKLLQIWHCLWLRLFLLFSVKHPKQSNEVLRTYQGQQFTITEVQLLVTLLKKGQKYEKRVMSYLPVWRLEKIIDQQEEFIITGSISSSSQDEAQIRQCLDVYSILCTEIPYLPKIEEGEHSQDKNQLLKHLQMLNDTLNFEIPRQDIDFRLYKKFSISQYILERISSYWRKYPRNQKRQYIMIYTHLFEQISYIAQLNKLHLVECCLLLYTCWITILNETKEIVFLNKLKKKLKFLNQEQYQIFESVRTNLSGWVTHFLIDRQKYSYFSIWDNLTLTFQKQENYPTKNAPTKLCSHQAILQLKTKLLILLCERYDIHAHQYFSSLDNPKQFQLKTLLSFSPLKVADITYKISQKETEKPNLECQIKYTNEIVDNGWEFTQNKDIEYSMKSQFEGQFQSMCRVARNNTMLTFNSAHNKQELNETRVVLLAEKNFVYQKLNTRRRIWKIGSDTLQNPYQIKIFEILEKSKEEAEDQLAANQSIQVFLIWDSQISQEDFLKYTSHKNIMKIFVFEKAILNPQKMIHKKLVICPKGRSIDEIIKIIDKEVDEFEKENKIFEQFNYSKVSGDKTKLNTFRNNLLWLLEPQSSFFSRQHYILFMEHFKQNFVASQGSQKVFEEFKRDFYSEDFIEKFKIIKWYKKETKFYEILNKALRILTSPMQLVYFQYPFSILFKSIKELYYRQKDLPFRQSKLICYRGCQISVKELSWLTSNVGQYIQLEGFLSTSKKKGIAQIFLGGCMLVITVPRSQSMKWNRFNNGFADISQQYQHAGEQQILFNPLNYFKITKYQQAKQDNLFYHQFHLEYCYQQSIPQQILKYQWIPKIFYESQGALFYYNKEPLLGLRLTYDKIKFDINKIEILFQLKMRNHYNFPYLLEIFKEISNKGPQFHSQLDNLVEDIFNKQGQKTLSPKQLQIKKYQLVKVLFYQLAFQQLGEFHQNQLISVANFLFYQQEVIQKRRFTVGEIFEVFEAVIQKDIGKGDWTYVKKLFQLISQKRAYFRRIQQINSISQSNLNSTTIQKGFFPLLQQFVLESIKKFHSYLQGPIVIEQEFKKVRYYRQNNQSLRLMLSLFNLNIQSYKPANSSLLKLILSEFQQSYQMIKDSGNINFISFTLKILLWIAIRLNDAKLINKYLFILMKALKASKDYYNYFLSLRVGAGFLLKFGAFKDLKQILDYSVVNIEISDIQQFSILLQFHKRILQLIGLTNNSISSLYRSKQEELFEMVVTKLPTLDFDYQLTFLSKFVQIQFIIIDYCKIHYYEKALVIFQLLQLTGYEQTSLEKNQQAVVVMIRVYREISEYYYKEGSLEDLITITKKGLLLLYNLEKSKMMIPMKTILISRWTLIYIQLRKYDSMGGEGDHYLGMVLEKAKICRQIQENPQFQLQQPAISVLISSIYPLIQKLESRMKEKGSKENNPEQSIDHKPQ